MRVALITPWDNAWVPYFKQSIETRGHEFAVVSSVEKLGEKPDVVIHGWTGQGPVIVGARNVMFLRRYELFGGGISKVRWDHIDALICVNSWIQEVVERTLRGNGHKTPVHLVYNGTDPGRWRFKERASGNKVGMACHVHPKKNIPLALQILGALPEHYELHVAGAVQDGCTAEYLNHVAKSMRRRLYLYDHVPAEQLSFWWEQMNYCLSTSLSEGNPNNVIEAMAKGIKPVVHNWPGAEDQFPASLRFSTVEQAVARITEPLYDSASYLQIVNEKFSLANIERAVDIALA